MFLSILLVFQMWIAFGTVAVVVITALYDCRTVPRSRRPWRRPERYYHIFLARLLIGVNLIFLIGYVLMDQMFWILP